MSFAEVYSLVVPVLAFIILGIRGLWLSKQS